MQLSNLVKKALVFGFALALATAASAQTDTTGKVKPAAWDSTYRPKGYPIRMTEFKANPITSNDIVFLGNSITAHADWAKLLNDPRAKNRGISGDITYGVLERLDEVIAGKPKKVFVLIGINDISRNIPDSLIERNHRLIVSRIRKGSPKTQIYFNTLLPVNASFGKFKNHYGKDEHILAVNEAIKKLAAKNVTIIDMYPVFMDADKHLKAEYTTDGLHPNDACYQVWAQFLQKGNYLK